MTTPLEKRLAAALRPLISHLRVDVTAIKKGDKDQVWTHEPLTPERLHRHLNGGPARGVSQIPAGGSVTMVGILDFDSHKGEVPWPRMVDAATDVMLSLELMGGAPIAFRSSGGRGVHVYCLWEQAQDAYSVRQWLTDALTSCGYKNGSKGGVATGHVEVFPKQDDVPADGFGNQVILPLSGKSVPLIFEPLAGGWVTGEREDALTMAWPMSDPVPVLEKPAPVKRDAQAVVGFDELKSVLDAIPNSGADELGYDDWFTVLGGTHHETGGSPEGLTLVHDFSARSGKYNPEKTDKDWGYARSEGRSKVVGIGSIKRIAARYGWHEPLTDEAFEDISAADSRPPIAATEWALQTDQVENTALSTAQCDTQNQTENKVGPGTQAGERGQSPPPPRVLPKVRRRGIPEAHYLTTDQANAQRLKNSFGSMVFVSAGRWYVWDGRRWVGDESDVYRYACRLSELIREEARPYRARAEVAKANGDTAEEKQMNAIADALGKWATRSEMKATIESAVGLARKMLTVDSEVLDRDPWALNCENGTVDLRTGELRRHNSEDYITKLVPVVYDAAAKCPTWDRALLEIVGGDEDVRDFLGRWFGYCATADVREQAFVVHWGGGANGKSTVLDTIREVLGDYAGTAAPGLLAATKGDRHPTEIAALFGRRMVTAHESGENIVLREDFIKQATGGDRITARYMREDFFEFSPTHKIQLLTNHKPQVKGTDEGIWRRVLLVPYVMSFGTAEQVARGERRMLGDVMMPTRLRGELPGILAWLVRGCLAWRDAGGLNPPKVVRVASEAYRGEQDRARQFVEECCEVGDDFTEPLTEGMGGLYPAYQSWCKDGGIFALSKAKFVDEVLRVVSRTVARAQATDRLLTVTGGGRRKVKMISGVRLLPE